ncbi:MAG: metalloregulator ArsR/SmtB family transcription factor [Chloroflexota bacterium]|nr:metalloregulator ArsR/SmtB family transcription factor [Chloroflexota bacterium]
MQSGRKTLASQLQPTRRKILLALKKSGGLTAGELSGLLGMTAMGVRRHLTTLEKDGLVTFDSQQRGMGRPAYVYHLTDLAEELFPKNYHILANELLGYLEEDELARVFERRAARRLRVGRARLAGLDFEQRIAELARLLDEDGYLAEWERVNDDTYLLREFNCAVHRVAYRYRQACATEIDFIQALLPEAEVQREQHIMSGDAACTYRISRRA